MRTAHAGPKPSGTHLLLIIIAPTSPSTKSGSDSLCAVPARSALFDLYGDHLTSGGNWAPSQEKVLLNTAAASLLPLAREFVDSCLSADARTRS